MDLHLIHDKKVKRIESKKRKAEAFLALVGRSKDSERTVNIDKTSDTSLKSTYFSPENESVIPLVNNSQSDKVACESKTRAEDAGGSDYPSASSDPVAEMKAILRERKRAAMQKPKFFLALEEMVPFRPMPQEPVREEEIPPLFVMDLQHLLLYGLQGNKASYKPRWCKLLRVGRVSSVILLVVSGLSYDDYINNKDHFPHLSNSFENVVEMVCPHQYGQTLENELINVPLSVSQLKKTAVKVPAKVMKIVAKKISQPVLNPSKEKMSRKCLLLSTYQMMCEGYPLPINTTHGKYRSFVFSKSRYEKVTENSPLFALDCEMCYTTSGRNELTRVSIVTENGELMYDTLVKPRNRILNYLTRYSGITKAMLDPVTTRIEDVQEYIQEHLPSDAILCGQSLNSDLVALHMFHPYVIDTSVIYNMSGQKGVKAGLRKLTQFFLGRSIQASKDGHCSTEDAIATLDLVKLKLSKGLEFGDATLSGVYFPDIHTYFMGPEDRGQKTSENVELEVDTGSNSGAEEDNTSVVVSSEPSSRKRSLSHSESEGESGESTAPPSKKDKPDSETLAHSSDKVAVMQHLQVPEVPRSTLPNGESHESQSTVNFVKTQQEFLFQQENSVHVPHSFFQLTKEAGRTAVCIDHTEDVQKYKLEPVQKVIVASDSDVKYEAKQLVKTKEFVMAHFKEAAMDVSSGLERVQKSMRKLDKRLHSILENVQANSLITVVLKGRTGENSANNMAVFVKTT